MVSQTIQSMAETYNIEEVQEIEKDSKEDTPIKTKNKTIFNNANFFFIPKLYYFLHLESKLLSRLL